MLCCQTMHIGTAGYSAVDVGSVGCLGGKEIITGSKRNPIFVQGCVRVSGHPVAQYSGKQHGRSRLHRMSEFQHCTSLREAWFAAEAQNLASASSVE